MLAVIVAPGPSAILCVTHGVAHGAKRTVSTIVGGMSASLTLMMLSALGLGGSRLGKGFNRITGGAEVRIWFDDGATSLPISLFCKSFCEGKPHAILQNCQNTPTAIRHLD